MCVYRRSGRWSNTEELQAEQRISCMWVKWLIIDQKIYKKIIKCDLTSAAGMMLGQHSEVIKTDIRSVKTDQSFVETFMNEECSETMNKCVFTWKRRMSRGFPAFFKQFWLHFRKNLRKNLEEERKRVTDGLRETLNVQKVSEGESL